MTSTPSSVSSFTKGTRFVLSETLISARLIVMPFHLCYLVPAAVSQRSDTICAQARVLYALCLQAYRFPVFRMLLRDNRSGVHAFVDVMNGNARHFHTGTDTPVRQRQSRECRKKRGMYINNAYRMLQAAYLQSVSYSRRERLIPPRAGAAVQ